MSFKSFIVGANPFDTDELALREDVFVDRMARAVMQVVMSVHLVRGINLCVLSGRNFTIVSRNFAPLGDMCAVKFIVNLKYVFMDEH